MTSITENADLNTFTISVRDIDKANITVGDEEVKLKGSNCIVGFFKNAFGDGTEKEARTAKVGGFEIEATYNSDSRKWDVQFKRDSDGETLNKCSFKTSGDAVATRANNGDDFCGSTFDMTNDELKFKRYSQDHQTEKVFDYNAISALVSNRGEVSLPMTSINVSNHNNHKHAGNGSGNSDPNANAKMSHNVVNGGANNARVDISNSNNSNVNDNDVNSSQANQGSVVDSILSNAQMNGVNNDGVEFDDEAKLPEEPTKDLTDKENYEIFKKKYSKLPGVNSKDSLLIRKINRNIERANLNNDRAKVLFDQMDSMKIRNVPIEQFSVHLKGVEQLEAGSKRIDQDIMKDLSRLHDSGAALRQHQMANKQDNDNDSTAVHKRNPIQFSSREYDSHDSVANTNAQVVDQPQEEIENDDIEEQQANEIFAEAVREVNEELEEDSPVNDMVHQMNDILDGVNFYDDIDDEAVEQEMWNIQNTEDPDDQEKLRRLNTI